jgi:hypothetical protein
MRKLLLFALVLLAACSKQQTSPILPDPLDESLSAGHLPYFVKYTIARGQQYCDQSSYVPTVYPELKFIVKFDSSAIYQTIDPANQDDINKLFGFSDNNADHHQFSARFGWRWSNNSLRLFGYTYNNGFRDSKELGIIAIGSENNCSIKVMPHQYLFSLNGSLDSMKRESLSVEAIGYKLFPYFGGDEMAPHDINIWIKELSK